MRFGLVPKRWILRHVQCFGVGHRIWHKDCTLASTFDGSHWGRRRCKNLDRILCILYFIFFSCVIWGCTLSKFNINLPFAKKEEIVFFFLQECTAAAGMEGLARTLIPLSHVLRCALSPTPCGAAPPSAPPPVSQRHPTKRKQERVTCCHGGKRKGMLPCCH